MTTKAVEVKKLYKIFAKQNKEKAAISLLEQGVPRSELKGFGTAAVIDVSFEVDYGEIFVVMGLSGSGKSTLIRTLNGLLEPSAGQVLIAGNDLTKLSPAQLRKVRREHVSMVFQHFALLPHLTVLENAGYGLEIQGIKKADRDEKTRKILEIVGLSDWADHYPEDLSGGMRQRVGLARALATDTKILLMDEAFSALDPLIRREMQEQLVHLQSELNKTIIFITHDLNEAMFLGDRIAMMRDGKVVQIGTPEDILTDPSNDYVAQFVQDVDRARILTASSVMEKPVALVQERSGPRAALKTMRDLQTSTLIVVDRNKRVVGSVLDRSVMKLVKSGVRELSSAIVHSELQTIAPDTLLSDIIPSSVENPLPLAVVDEKNTLLGLIPRVTLLAALGNVSTDTGEFAQAIPPNTVPLALMDQTLADTTSNEESAGK